MDVSGFLFRLSFIKVLILDNDYFVLKRCYTLIKRVD